MLVSVIIPHFNDLANLDRALQSVKNQTYQYVEIIVVNDGGPLCIYSPYYKASFGNRIKIVNIAENVGPAKARNIGLNQATGEFIAFLDSDDSWHPKKVSIQIAAMNEQKASFSAHSYEENSELPDFIHSPPKIKFRNTYELLFFSFIHTPTVMARREGFKEFPVDLKLAEDFVCWVKNLEDRDCLFLENHLARGYKSAVGDAGLTENMNRLHRAQIVAIRKLYVEKAISYFYYITATLWEYLKYPIRKVVK
jgi:glycosyltransferase involved in cell wall biosynthesis